eukprot:gene1204-4416_t
MPLSLPEPMFCKDSHIDCGIDEEGGRFGSYLLKAIALPTQHLRVTVFGTKEQAHLNHSTGKRLKILYNQTSHSCCKSLYPKRRRCVSKAILDRLLCCEDDSLQEVFPLQFQELFHQQQPYEFEKYFEDRQEYDQEYEDQFSYFEGQVPCAILQPEERWPHRCLYEHLAQSIRRWAVSSQYEDIISTAQALSDSMLQQEDLQILASERGLSPHCRVLRGTLSIAFQPSSSEDAIIQAFDQLLSVIHVSDIQWFLGMQHTPGTVAALPPQCRTQQGQSILTQGARALLKHCNRDNSLKFWGDPSGTEKVFEVRTPLGYGARWTLDGKKFRGFLEPQVKDGHDYRWYH